MEEATDGCILLAAPVDASAPGPGLLGGRPGGRAEVALRRWLCCTAQEPAGEVAAGQWLGCGHGDGSWTRLQRPQQWMAPSLCSGLSGFIMRAAARASHGGGRASAGQFPDSA